MRDEPAEISYGEIARFSSAHWDTRPADVPEVALEATYGWYWAVDVLADAGAQVHLAHPLAVKGSPTGG